MFDIDPSQKVKMTSVPVELLVLLGLAALFNRSACANDIDHHFLEIRENETRKYKTTTVFHALSSVQCSLHCLRNRQKCSYVRKKKLKASNSFLCEFLQTDDRGQFLISVDEQNFELGLISTDFKDVTPCDKYKDGPSFLTLEEPARMEVGLPVVIDCNAMTSSLMTNSTVLQIEERLISSPYTPTYDDNGKNLSCSVSHLGCIEIKTALLEVSQGWTLLQRRVNGNIAFYRGWSSFRDGFGTVDGDFWLGLEAAHILMQNKNATMRLNMWDGPDYYWADYYEVSLSDEGGDYRLSYKRFYGNANDDMYLSNNQRFSTKDRDNDASSSIHCAESYGGWWMSNCFKCNLNGKFGSTEFGKGIMSYSITGWDRSLSKTEIKIKIN